MQYQITDTRHFISCAAHARWLFESLNPAVGAAGPLNLTLPMLDCPWSRCIGTTKKSIIAVDSILMNDDQYLRMIYVLCTYKTHAESFHGISTILDIIQPCLARPSIFPSLFLL